uniref:Ferritin n=1 Tax=Timema monikensis TaxID=170555 RepID=A0A7R9E4Z5_9NEOP|nr:unnamed protein product [Timema monikensis]
MKAIYGIVVLIAAIYVQTSTAKLQCQLAQGNIPTKWITMVDPCIKKMREQVQVELRAAVSYLAMGAHFSKDTVNRPGFAKIFFDAASEEREHAIKIIEYLLMRGELTSKVGHLIKNPMPAKESWETGVEALKDALGLETDVTVKIRDIIKECETPTNKCKDGVDCEQMYDFNDYHLVDYLTGDFLEEQYRGQRDLAGKASTLEKMMKTQGALGEFLFDKKLLNGEPL